VRDAAAFGASYLVKPVVPSELLAMIQQQLAPLSAAG
jgi:DNA-binding response OmpR family regulator